MIYVEEKNFGRQLELLKHLVLLDNMKVCAWAYPDLTAENLAGYSLMERASELEPITIYEDGSLPRHTELVPASLDSLASFEKVENEMTTGCDSIALYKDGELSWYAATIGHEGMCLVRSDVMLDSLVSAGFNASCKVPSWW